MNLNFVTCDWIIVELNGYMPFIPQLKLVAYANQTLIDKLVMPEDNNVLIIFDTPKKDKLEFSLQKSGVYDEILGNKGVRIPYYLFQELNLINTKGLLRTDMFCYGL